MKALATIVVLLLLALLTIALWPAHYQYRAIAVPEAHFRSVMDALGADGWELVTARRTSNSSNASASSYEVILKRRAGFLLSDRHSSNTALANIIAAGGDPRPTPTSTPNPVMTKPPSTVSATTVATVAPPPPGNAPLHLEVSAQQQFEERLRIARTTGRVFMDAPGHVYHQPNCPSVKPWMRDGFVSVAKLSGLHPAPDCHKR